VLYERLKTIALADLVLTLYNKTVLDLWIFPIKQVQNLVLFSPIRAIQSKSGSNGRTQRPPRNRGASL
jgi:hypothetical protein